MVLTFLLTAFLALTPDRRLRRRPLTSRRVSAATATAGLSGTDAEARRGRLPSTWDTFKASASTATAQLHGLPPRT